MAENKNNLLEPLAVKLDSKGLAWLPWALGALFLYVLLMNAWACDDAYITFRVADNFLSGFGLTWNPGERVQAFTHPLWLFLLIPFVGITGEVFFTSIILSILLCLGSVYLLCRLSSGRLNFIGAILILLMSKGFMDFAAAGLENPLSYLLAGLFLFVFFKNEENNSLLILSLIASLSAVNRLDTVLIYLPALIYLFWRQKNFKSFLLILAGFLPLIIWEIFSLIYYGFPFPNTAYAKLGAGVPLYGYINQGLKYFRNSLAWDPVTLITILFAAILPFAGKKLFDRNAVWLISLGIILYLLYIIRIGGDFMSGRFFGLPLFFSVGMLAAAKPNFKKVGSVYAYAVVAALILVNAFVSRGLPLLSGPGFGSEAKTAKNFLEIYYDDFDIADERIVYYPECGLLPVLQKGESGPMYYSAKNGAITARSEMNKVFRGLVGYFGYYAGPEVHIVDKHALGDAFLSRLPSAPDPEWPRSEWRIGHFYRRLPKGYFECAGTDNNTIEKEQLAELYDHLKKIIHGSLFGNERFSSIIKLNSGAYEIPDNYEAMEITPPGSADSLTLAVYHNGIGMDLYRNGNIEEAIPFLEKACGFQPDHPDYFVNLTSTLLEAERFDRTGELLKSNLSQESLRFDKRIFALWYNFVSDLFETGNNEKAAEIIAYYLQNHPQRAKYFRSMAQKMKDGGRQDNALAALKAILLPIPTAAVVYGDIAEIYFEQNKLDSAEYYARKMKNMGGRLKPELRKLLDTNSK